MGEKTKKIPVRVTANTKRAIKIETDKKEETCKVCPPLSQCSTVSRCRDRRDCVMGLFCTPASIYSALLPLLSQPRHVAQAYLSGGKGGHSCAHLPNLTVSTLDCM